MLDEKVIQYYRMITREGYKYAGSFENPTLFLDDLGKKITTCSNLDNTFMHIFINIRDGIIEDIKYLCTCGPTANVAAEIFCSLVKGRAIEEAEALTEESFSMALRTKGEDFLKSARGIIDLFHKGLDRYKAGIVSATQPVQ